MAEGTVVSVPMLADGRGLRDVPLDERWSHPRTSLRGRGSGTELIQLFPRGRAHSLWVVRDTTHAMVGWYVNLEDVHELARRDDHDPRPRPRHLGARETGRAAVEGRGRARGRDARVGRVTPEQATAIRAEGERVWRERPWPTAGRTGGRRRSGRRPTLPAGWRRVSCAPSGCGSGRSRRVTWMHTRTSQREVTRARACTRAAACRCLLEQARKELLDACTSWRERDWGHWMISDTRRQLHRGDRGRSRALTIHTSSRPRLDRRSRSVGTRIRDGRGEARRSRSVRAHERHSRSPRTSRLATRRLDAWRRSSGCGCANAERTAAEGSRGVRAPRTRERTLRADAALARRRGRARRGLWAP